MCIRDRPCIVIYCHYLPELGLGNLRACCLPWTVSYTHLDVYKRQLLLYKSCAHIVALDAIKQLILENLGSQEPAIQNYVLKYQLN